MTFHEFEEKMLQHFNHLQNAYGTAFMTAVDREELWVTYLESIPAAINPIYRTRREFDCACCRNFIKNIGGVVFVDEENQIHTLWDFEVDDPNYQVVLTTVDAYVRSHRICDKYLTDLNFVGTRQNFGRTPEGGVETYEHFFLPIPSAYRYKGVSTIATEQAKYRDEVHVFERSLGEISVDAIDVVLDLIKSNTLYRGAEWEHVLEVLKKHKKAYDVLDDAKKTTYAWANAEKVGPAISKIRNHSIGVLLTDITAGTDLNDAVTKYEKIVAPANYQRPKAIFTVQMVKKAEETIKALGYEDSLERRFATLDDITINNILFSNRDSAKHIQGSVFEDMMGKAINTGRKFDRVEEISIEQAVRNVFPRACELEAYVENRQEANFVSLIAPVHSNAPSMFKWDNAFGWAYTGDITDSGIRENVKNAGGNIHGVLRFSIQWNDGAEVSRNDLDAHCTEPDRHEIFYGNKHSLRTNGTLDVDIIHPETGRPAVENIVWASKQQMIPGNYCFYVHQYTNRGGRDGFRAEIEFDGKIYKYNYARELRQDERVEVAVVTLHEDGTLSIKETIPSSRTPREIWGVRTMEFVPVSVVMYSPNYWDGQSGIGNKHYFFMLKGCVNPERPNGFYNEFLKSELKEHKRVLEALGSRMAVADADDQLSGLGFSSTLRNHLVVKVKGSTERILKVLF